MDQLRKSEIKASAILYVTSAIMLLFGILIPLIDMAGRSHNAKPVDTFVELLEWNPFSEWGLILCALSLFHFWLGILTDRRGA